MNDKRQNGPRSYPCRGVRSRAAVRGLAVVWGLALLAACPGCHVTVDPIRVEPIHLTLDITLKVDRELDRFFDFEDPGSPPTNDIAPTEPVDEGVQS